MVFVHAFVADIHLRPDAGAAVERFVSWLTLAGRDAQEVFILGDLFDYWYTGMETAFPAVIDALRSPGVHVLPGNRDFLLRNARCRGIDIVEAEEAIISVGGKRVLLAHGHTLTGADVGFRLLHRFGWPVLELMDRALPSSVKDLLARALVRSSAVVRPSETAIRHDIAGAKGVDMVICGHLHRHVEREGLVVLPAFFDTGAWLSWGPSGPSMRALP